MLTWVYSGSLLDGSRHGLVFADRKPNRYEVGKVYVIAGRQWRCEGVSRYPPIAEDEPDTAATEFPLALGPRASRESSTGTKGTENG